MLIDTHVHLNRREFTAELSPLLSRATAAGVTRFLNVGYDWESSRQSVELARADHCIAASVGVHPHDASLLADPAGRLTTAGEQLLANLEILARDPRVVAIGEIGLDYYRDLSPRPAQQAALTVQLDLAERVGLPVIFHIREAYPETVALIEQAGIPSRRGVLHAFAGDEDTARWAKRNGMRLGIGGPVTYKNSGLPEVLVGTSKPADLLLETDAPWLPPAPHRGQRNEPSYLPLIAAEVASLYGWELEALADQTSRNCIELFGDWENGGSA
jgi:TatD DNase family protein